MPSQIKAYLIIQSTKEGTGHEESNNIKVAQGTGPEAIIAFLDSSDYESAVRLAFSLGGESDTLACITDSIAEAFYKQIPRPIVTEIWQRLPDDFIEILQKLEKQTLYKLPKIQA